MKEFFQIAGQVAGLAGIALVVFLAIAKAIVGKTRDVNQTQSFKLLNLLLILAAVITALGMASWLVSLAIEGDISVRMRGLDVEENKKIGKLEAETASLREQLRDYETKANTEIENAIARNDVEAEELARLRSMERKIDEMGDRVASLMRDVEEIPAPKPERVTASLEAAQNALAARVPILALTMGRSAGGSPFRGVPVTARTLVDGNEVSGYVIYYVPKAFQVLEKVDDHARRFAQLSSPAMEVLAPGNYVFWVEIDGKRGSPTEFAVR
ncbi:MAG: hypothetical protein V3T53_04020 [Phycisphaerales bacterium]